MHNDHSDNSTTIHTRSTQQRALYNLGLTGIPITNVNNNCSTGSTALYQANTLVKSGLVECALALGFERMSRGSLGSNFPDRPSPTAPLNTAALQVEESLTSGKNFGPWAPRMFANGAQEYFDKYGADITHLAQIGKDCQVFVFVVLCLRSKISFQEPQTLCE